MHSKNLRAYLGSAAGIAGLLPQAERLIELRRIYSKLLPQQLLRASSIVNYRQQTVVIFAENSSVAAKLRLLSPRLVNDFSKFGTEVTGIRVEVQPKQGPVREMVPKRAQLSPAGAERLEALAKQLPDSKLKQALAAMAARDKATQGPDPQAQGEERQPNPK
ncbi:MAG TPA: DciA family protein [Burkholderiales bacterium]|nr:DciA family protein [Burkholderiales bacterium]